MSDPIVEELRAERKRRGWSQTQLGNEIGHATYGGVWAWENYAQGPKLSSLRMWAAALGYEVVLVPAGELRGDPS